MRTHREIGKRLLADPPTEEGTEAAEEESPEPVVQITCVPLITCSQCNVTYRQGERHICWR
jgi:hypothetical protein